MAALKTELAKLGRARRDDGDGSPDRPACDALPARIGPTRITACDELPVAGLA